MPKLRVKRKGYTRKAYKRKDGTRVKGARVSGGTYLTKDRGKRGRTPKSQRWYKPSVETGWEKNMSMAERRRLALKAHKGDALSTARSMQSLANVTTDSATKRAARSDALYFYAENRKKKK